MGCVGCSIGVASMRMPPLPGDIDDEIASTRGPLPSTSVPASPGRTLGAHEIRAAGRVSPRWRRGWWLAGTTGWWRWRGLVPGEDLAHRFGSGVRVGQVGWLGDLAVGVGDDDACLFFDRRGPLRVATGDGGAVAQQPQQRIGDGGLAGAVAADEPAHHGEVVGEPPARDDHRGPVVAVEDVVSQRAGGERAEDHRQVIDGLDRGVGIVRASSFRSLEHATTGRAIVLRRPAGHLILRMERLSTSNGPDLRVYLSRVPASSDLHAYRTGFIDLGALKGNQGSQNYAIPPEP